MSGPVRLALPYSARIHVVYSPLPYATAPDAAPVAGWTDKADITVPALTAQNAS